MEEIMKRVTSVIVPMLAVFTLSSCNWEQVLSWGGGAASMAKEIAPRILDAGLEARKTDSVKEKAKIYAALYCELRKDYPDYAEKLRARVMLAVPSIAVAATKRLVNEKCGAKDPQDTASSTSWEPGMPGAPDVGAAVLPVK
tara:strand:- start:279 stop:704 length:426 start_codon:yes stop_codon:yes gene_type:complete